MALKSHNMVFKVDKDFVTKVALRAFAPPQLLRQFCRWQNRFCGTTSCYVDARTGVHREKVFLSLLVSFIQFFFSSCTTLYVYDTYENNRNTYEDDRAMIIILLIVLAFQIKSMHTIGILSFLK